MHSKIQYFSGKTLNQRMSELMSTHNVTLTELHSQTGVAMPTIKRIQSDSACNPTVSSLLPIASFFEITMDQLLGIQALNNNNHIHSENVTTKPHNVFILSWDEINCWLTDNKCSTENTISTEKEISNKGYALKIPHNNWLGFLKDSLIIIDPAKSFENNTYVIAKHKENKIPSLKQCLIEDNQIYLKSLISDNIHTLKLDKNFVYFGTVIQIRNDSIYE